ncbi:MAG TPA: hypothetical protein VGW58_03910, partial [Pyrinomonadaceae bacterium]|nr:hypothetical protein [Pyrinomonadaceae bacterium]
MNQLVTGRDFVLQLPDGYRVSALAKAAQTGRFSANGNKCIAEPLDQVRMKQTVVWKLDESLFYCDQMSGEIAAIHGGDVLRQERLEAFCVVPIKKVAVQTAQSGQRRKRQFMSLDQFQSAKITKVAGAGSGQYQQADVCRGSAVCYDRHRIFLEIIGRQPVVFG